LGKLDGQPRQATLRCGDSSRVAIEGKYKSVRANPFREQSGVAAATQGTIHHDLAGQRLKIVEDFFVQNGDVNGVKHEVK
jgi:hypothetical protein